MREIDQQHQVGRPLERRSLDLSPSTLLAQIVRILNATCRPVSTKLPKNRPFYAPMKAVMPVARLDAPALVIDNGNTPPGEPVEPSFDFPRWAADDDNLRTDIRSLAGIAGFKPPEIAENCNNIRSLHAVGEGAGFSPGVTLVATQPCPQIQFHG